MKNENKNWVINDGFCCLTHLSQAQFFVLFRYLKRQNWDQIFQAGYGLPKVRSNTIYSELDVQNIGLILFMPNMKKSTILFRYLFFQWTFLGGVQEKEILKGNPKFTFYIHIKFIFLEFFFNNFRTYIFEKRIFRNIFLKIK